MAGIGVHMASLGDIIMGKFPFSDLHSFKDYVGFVKLCAPDMFPLREGVQLEDQWTLDLAFEGLRHGIDLAILEKGNHPRFERSKTNRRSKIFLSCGRY